MKDIIQRFGAAMFVPVLLFPAAGMLLGLSVMLLNQDLFPWAVEGSAWVKVSTILLQASLAVFKNMALVFAVGLPIALAKSASGRAVLATLVSYITFNYVIGGILQFWGPELGVNYVEGERGLTDVGGILTLDTNLLGAIVIASLSVWVHNRFFDKKLPNWAAVFGGTPLVVIVSFPIIVLMAIITCFTWPSIQHGINNLQTFLVGAGSFGVWMFTFLERIMIPTGLHHFVYGPVFYGPVAVDGGTVAHWIQNIQNFASNPAPLTEQFPQGGLMLTGMGKVFGCTGIAMALYATAKPENKKMVLGLVLGAALTAILTGITEPIEFTFLFIAPALFALHAVLAATMATIAYWFGVSGNFQTGLIDFIFQNWLPLGSLHGDTYIVQVLIGLSFTAIYFVVFRALIVKFDIPTPGRGSAEAKLYTKADYKGAQQNDSSSGVIDGGQASAFIEGLGGKDNIALLTNCATRLRIKVHEPEKVAETQYFQEHGAVNMVRNGDSFQIIVGLTVPQVREEMTQLIRA
ncbi:MULTISPECIES: alpha-glucoside-specific PTS transporter subunit IIBC [Enterobacteriaceae]|uniref:alpha-glucoside-specific PTS transporter subunit IIBC n=1 Tax=Enterobacteriaceae TaxID=543 RepID=UPI00024FCE8C|nr:MULTISPECIES: alpha-glucoside-specific PTS transporter subunit IIBC [Enterobacteriaceae]HBV8601994.1 PTS transporter subunit EIIC [Klebsiella oxytoca]EFD4874297.1 alpha-glucoside-specific phosphotransferase enzyme IIB component [Escherichia coli]EFE0887858.1 alpha-glucoside-specific phosphotransferase enzyme IIB component [Escherichia coli]EFE7989845.1 alpha-glucoside-specific phosphotransferase enzyme IIB component [Escherichia coli]EFH7924651.1 alpha-glucoside-specific phosphotransferase 